MTSRKISVRVGMVVMGAGIACALALLTATHGPVAAAPEPQIVQAAQSSEPPKTYEGVVTDTHCSAKHSAPLAESAGDCTRVCVHAGEKFALVDGDRVYVLEGEEAALKRAAGERVKVTGTLNGNILSVASVRSSTS